MNDHRDTNDELREVFELLHAASNGCNMARIKAGNEGNDARMYRLYDMRNRIDAERERVATELAK